MEKYDLTKDTDLMRALLDGHTVVETRHGSARKLFFVGCELHCSFNDDKSTRTDVLRYYATSTFSIAAPPPKPAGEMRLCELIDELGCQYSFNEALRKLVEMKRAAEGGE